MKEEFSEQLEEGLNTQNNLRLAIPPENGLHMSYYTKSVFRKHCRLLEVIISEVCKTEVLFVAFCMFSKMFSYHHNPVLVSKSDAFNIESKKQWIKLFQN